MVTRLMRTALFVALGALGAASATAAETAIYRCRDVGGQVLYTDEPCKGGDRLELHPGEADPAAMQALASVRDALDRSAAERRLELAAESARKAANRARGEAEVAAADQSDAAIPYYAYPAGVVRYPPQRGSHPPRNASKLREKRRPAPTLPDRLPLQ